MRLFVLNLAVCFCLTGCGLQKSKKGNIVYPTGRYNIESISLYDKQGVESTYEFKADRTIFYMDFSPRKMRDKYVRGRASLIGDTINYNSGYYCNIRNMIRWEIFSNNQLSVSWNSWNSNHNLNGTSDKIFYFFRMSLNFENGEFLITNKSLFIISYRNREEKKMFSKIKLSYHQK